MLERQKSEDLLGSDTVWQAAAAAIAMRRPPGMVGAKGHVHGSYMFSNLSCK